MHIPELTAEVSPYPAGGQYSGVAASSSFAGQVLPMVCGRQCCVAKWVERGNVSAEFPFLMCMPSPYQG